MFLVADWLRLSHEREEWGSSTRSEKISKELLEMSSVSIVLSLRRDRFNHRTSNHHAIVIFTILSLSLNTFEPVTMIVHICLSTLLWKPFKIKLKVYTLITSWFFFVFHIHCGVEYINKNPAKIIKSMSLSIHFQVYRRAWFRFLLRRRFNNILQKSYKRITLCNRIRTRSMSFSTVLGSPLLYAWKEGSAGVGGCKERPRRNLQGSAQREEKKERKPLPYWV